MAIADTINRVMRGLPVWAVYLGGLAPLPILFWMGATGGLGVDPIESLEHRYGLLGLQFLVAGLCVSLLRRFLGINLIRLRRAIGLIAFYYIVAHLSVWLILDLHSLSAAWEDVLERPYITVGMGAFVLLVPLAATSNDYACRKLGPAWRRLHRLTYIAVPLGAAHYVMLSKGWQLEPLIYAALIAALLAARVWPKRRVGALRLS